MEVSTHVSTSYKTTTRLLSYIACAMIIIVVSARGRAWYEAMGYILQCGFSAYFRAHLKWVRELIDPHTRLHRRIYGVGCAPSLFYYDSLDYNI